MSLSPGNYRWRIIGDGVLENKRKTPLVLRRHQGFEQSRLSEAGGLRFCGHGVASFLAVIWQWSMGTPIRAGANMTNPFLFALIVSFWFAEATLTAGALAVPAAILDMRSIEASGAFILVRKGKGHGDGEERFERHRRHEAYGFSRHRRHSHGRRGFNGIQGFGNYSGSRGGNQNQPDGQN